MALVKDKLKKDLKDIFDKAFEENWASEKVAGAIADAIYNFIMEAEIDGIETDVVLDLVSETGTGTQKTGTGEIK